MPTPMPSASNSWAREKLASAILDLASASAPSCGSLSRSVATRLTTRGLPRLVLADLGVAGDHVRHLVRQHRGELGVVVGERDQAAGDVELAVRQREGVDRRRVEDGDLVFQLGPLGGGDELVDGLLQHVLHARVAIDAAIGRQDAQMLALLGGGEEALLLRRRGGGRVGRASAAWRWSRRRAAGSARCRARRSAEATPPRSRTSVVRALTHGRPNRAPRSRSAPAPPPRSTGRRAPRSCPAP